VFDEIECIDVGCINGDNFYFLLVYFSFYYYGVSLFISFDQRTFEIYFVQDKYCYPCLFFGDDWLGKSSSRFSLSASAYFCP
jgi:hypothetical protein